jgi:hypothetical protein
MVCPSEWGQEAWDEPPEAVSQNKYFLHEIVLSGILVTAAQK